MRPSYLSDASYYDMQRVFVRGVTVRDIAEPLLSFDAWTQAVTVREILTMQGQLVAGIREDGRTCGYVRTGELGKGMCGEFAQAFDEKLVLGDSSTLVDVVLALTDSPYAFVRVLGEVGGIVTRDDLQDPPVRMWLFGMVTIIEMYYLRIIEQRLGDESWRQYLSPARVAKAEELLEERRRRNQNPRLLDCLQFGDKAQIMARNEELRKLAGFRSRNRAEQAMKMVERLRNNLAHTQDIVAWDWETIVLLAQNIDRLIDLDVSGRG
jgi:hypothetical protein